MTVEALVVAGLICNLLTLAGLLIVFNRMGGQHRDARDLDKRLTRLEARVDNLPTHRDLSTLNQAITETAEGVASINGQMLAMTRMMQTIQEHLLEND